MTKLSSGSINRGECSYSHGHSELRSIASRLGGEVRGKQILCPGPGHSARDRSLAVLFSPSAPDGFVVYSFAGDDPARSKDFIRRKLGWVGRWRSGKPVLAARSIEDEALRVAERAGEYARAVWRGAESLKGTPADHYLRSRHIIPPAKGFDTVLRFHAACPWRDDVTQQSIPVPAMIGAVRSISTGEITGIHRTRLTSDGHKVARRMLGRVVNAAIMLTPSPEINGSLVIGEGIETSLSAFSLGYKSIWALGSAGSISSFPLLRGLQILMILSETGDGGASARAIGKVGTRYLNAGRQVFIVEPCVGNDLNDAICRMRR